MHLNIDQSRAHEVNGYVVVSYDDTHEVIYECERRYWEAEVRAMYNDLKRNNINCPMYPYEVLVWNEKPKVPYRVAYFAILED